MQRKDQEAFVKVILKQGIIIIGISIVVSIISLILTVDFSQSNILYFELFIMALSDFTFFFGMISIFVGLLIAFFKKPRFSNDPKSEEPKFKPVYKKKKPLPAISSQKKKTSTDLPLFSPRELKLILSGSISVVLGISIWIIYFITKNLFL